MSDEDREDLAQSLAPGLCLSKVYAREENNLSGVVLHEV